MARLQMTFLGNFAVILDAQAVETFAYDKVRALLAFLVIESNFPQHRERLADLLWPDYPEQSARRNLSQALSRLRHALGDAQGDFLSITARDVQFNCASDHGCDVHAFAAHLQAAQAHSPADADHTVHLEAATALYRGDFLADLLLPDSAPFEEWALLERERLRSLCLDALEHLAESYLAQKNAEAALQVARRQLALDGWREPAHRQVMRALILSGQRTAALAHYEACRQALAADLGVEPEVATLELARALKAQPLPGEEARIPAWWPRQTEDLAPAPGAPPFKGLVAFDVPDADRYFGREALITRLLRQLAPVTPYDPRAGETHFLAIIGASGSGKSSLVRAGLAATLLREHPDYPLHILTPTAQPLEALAWAVAGEGDPAGAALAAAMALDPQALRTHLLAQQQPMAKSQKVRNSTRATPDSLLPTSSPTLLIVDQFEEVFTLCRDPEIRRAFIANLLIAVQGKDAPAFALLTLRADFYEHCAAYPALCEAISRHQVYIGPMSADGLRRAIEEPARCGGWAFEPGLVELLLRDAGVTDGQQPEPGALPLLSHALLETWNRRRGRTLTLGGYAEAGGVQGAIATTAEATYQHLEPEKQALTRNIFLRLTELGEGTQDTRRRVALTELRAQHPDAEVVNGVLAQLADARLIVTEHETAQVAHEALIREWPTLQGWLEADREGLRLHRHLTEAAQAWERLARDAGELYRGARLAQAMEWASTHTTALNALEQEFLDASQADAERRQAEREAQRQRELEAARQLAETEQRRAAESQIAARKLRSRARILAFAAVGILLAAVLAMTQWRQARETAQENATLADANANIAATAVAVSELEAAQRAEAETARTDAEQARDEAQQQTRRALATKLAALATAAVGDEYGLALLLSAQAYSTLDIPQTRGSMPTVLEHQPALRRMLTYGGAASDLDISPDGTLLAASGRSVGFWVGTLSLWDMATGQPLLSAERIMADSLEHVEFSPDGKTLVVIGCGARDEDDNCTQAEIMLWDVAQSEVRWRATGHTGWPNCVTFSPDGTLLASCADEGGVWLWDAATGRAIQQLNTEAVWIYSLAYSPDGATLAAGACMALDETEHCARGDVLLWDTASGELRAQWPSHTGDILSVDFSPDGALLAAGGCVAYYEFCIKGETVVWNVETGERYGPVLGGHTDDVWSVAFSPDGRLLATGAADKLVRLWNVATGEPATEPLVDHNQIRGVAFSPDGKILASAGEGTAIRLWDVAKLQETMPRHIDTMLVRAMPMGALALNPDKTIAATSNWFTGEILRWDLATGAPIGEPIPAHAGPSTALTFSPDGKLLASGGYDAVVGLWDVETGKPVVPPMTGHTSIVYTVEFSLRGDILVSASDDGTLRLWDVATGKPAGPNQGILDQQNGIIFDVAFSPDGSRLAFGTASAEPIMRLLDWQQASATAQLSAEWPIVGGVNGVTFDPTGDILVVGAGLPQYALTLWDVKTQQRIGGPMIGHKYNPWRLAFSPDGELLASGGLDSALRLWDVATGEPIGPSLTVNPQYMVGAIMGLAFSDDGRTLYTASTDGTLRTWSVAPDAWREEVCAIAGRNLTQAEWARYMLDVPYEKTCPQWPAGE